MNKTTRILQGLTVILVVGLISVTVAVNMFLLVFVGLLFVGSAIYSLGQWQKLMPQHRRALQLLKGCAVLIFIAGIWHAYNVELQKEQWKLEPVTKKQIE